MEELRGDPGGASNREETTEFNPESVLMGYSEPPTSSGIHNTGPSDAEADAVDALMDLSDTGFGEVTRRVLTAAPRGARSVATRRLPAAEWLARAQGLPANVGPVTSLEEMELFMEVMSEDAAKHPRRKGAHDWNDVCKLTMTRWARSARISSYKHAHLHDASLVRPFAANVPPSCSLRQFGEIERSDHCWICGSSSRACAKCCALSLWHGCPRAPVSTSGLGILLEADDIQAQGGAYAQGVLRHVP